MLKQTTDRIELVSAITVTLILLPILIVSGLEYRAEFTPALEPILATHLAVQGRSMPIVEPMPEILESDMIGSAPARDLIPIVAIASKIQSTLATAVASTTKPTFTHKLVSTPAPSDPLPLPPTRLLIPAIDLEAPVVAVDRVNTEINGQPVTTWAVPDSFSVGWHNTSALPGQIGNTLINGHSNIYGEVFRNLEALELGDEIIIYVDDAVYRYQVTEWHLLREEDISWEDRTENTKWMLPTKEERLTLFTCAPYPENTHRLVVVALPVEAEFVVYPQ
ncbi:MAG: sortase [Chloroflexi bacterium]|nr:sortase [Chloroflexota bacterium]